MHLIWTEQIVFQKYANQNSPPSIYPQMYIPQGSIYSLQLLMLLYLNKNWTSFVVHINAVFLGSAGHDNRCTRDNCSDVIAVLALNRERTGEESARGQCCGIDASGP